MSQTNLWKQFVLARKNLLRTLQTVPESVVDVQPVGFNNTLRWNVGHILTVAEQFLFGLTNREFHLPSEYKSLFGNGTKPSDWNGDVPSFSTLVAQLEDQLARAEGVVINRLDEALENPFVMRSTGVQFDTVGEILNLAIYHEGNHTGYINALQRVVTAQTE
jgi:uncharacterized damage-inducible protein DinB